MTVTILAFLIIRLLGCLLGVSVFLSVSTRGDLWQASGQYTLSYSKMVFTTDYRVHRLAMGTFLSKVSHDGEGRGGGARPPLSLYLPPPSELPRPLHPLPSKTSDRMLLVAEFIVS
jgi:hypothetical protein